MWSDNLKRIVCRLAFLLLCALPTSATIYQILHPQTADDWEQKIQSQLGIRTRIDSVETPGPYETILRGLKFYDVDGYQILEATELGIRFAETNLIEIVDPIRVKSNGLQHIASRIAQRVVRSHAVDRQWLLRIQSAIVQSDVVMDDHFGTPRPRELWLENAIIDIASDFDATGVRLEFNLLDLSAPTPAGEPNRIACSLRREKFPSIPGSNLPQQWVTVNTGDDALPCWLASQWLPKIVDSLGAEVEFSGGFEIDTGSPDLRGQAVGQFYNVDLRQIVGDVPANHLLARKAVIDLATFQFHAGDVQHEAFLSIPGSGTPRVRMEKPLEVIERFDLSQAIRNAAVQTEHQSTDTIRR